MILPRRKIGAKMVKQALALSEWFVEIFPKVLFTLYRVTYDEKTDAIEWMYLQSADDTNDCATVLIYGVGKDFFQRVVVPRLVLAPEASWCFAGEDRVIVTFKPAEDRHCRTRLGYCTSFEGRWRFTDCWMSREIGAFSLPVQI
jgi:hypothetical protein